MGCSHDSNRNGESYEKVVDSMTRRQAREYILKALYQYEFAGAKPDREEIINKAYKKGEVDSTLDFIEDIINGTINQREEIDGLIQSVAQNWELHRLASIDRNILRFSTYELLYREDIPAVVSINEAVDIAKKYSTAESYSFINGVLDKIAHQRKTKHLRA